MTEFDTSVIALNGQNFGDYASPMSLFWTKWFKAGFPNYLYESWSSDVDPDWVFDALPSGTRVERSENYQRYHIYEDEGVLVWVEYQKPTQWEFHIATVDRTTGQEILALFRDLVPVLLNNEDNVVPIRFWSLDHHGAPSQTVRKVESHKWADVRGNYEMGVRTKLDDLMDIGAPGGSGKLVLWHGPPGTGKTNCIRALAQAWRDWCDVDYVVDPEDLFGRAHYMMSALVNGNEDKWRLVVIEDSGEFLRKDAKQQAGQSFGRLLNLTDGLVGQGLKLIILVTTNEPFGELHPAVARPGRCLSHLEFGMFPPEEASKWLGHKVHEPMTLADLYEAKAEVQPQITKDRSEFRPGVYA